MNTNRLNDIMAEKIRISDQLEWHRSELSQDEVDRLSQQLDALEQERVILRRLDAIRAQQQNLFMASEQAPYHGFGGADLDYIQVEHDRQVAALEEEAHLLRQQLRTLRGETIHPDFRGR